MDTNTRIMTQNFSRFISKIPEYCILFVYSKLIKPRSPDEDTQRKEFILNTVLLCFLTLMALLTGSVIRNSIIQADAYRGVSPILFTALDMIFLSVYLLSRRGYIQTASIIFLFLFGAAVSFGALSFGADLSQIIFSFVLLIVISGILLGSRQALIVTAIVASLTTFFWYHQLPQFKTERWVLDHEAQAGDGMELALMYGVVGIVTWLANRQVENSLKRARSSEHALIQERDSLEIKVEDRTRQLKQAQLEKITELYRFVEFGKLSSGLFHDILNPLTALSLNIQNLEDVNQKALPEVREAVDRAVRASKRIENSVTAIRKQLRTQESLTAFSPAQEITEALDLLEFKAQKENVALRSDISNEPLSLFGDPIKFYQIAVNLISNAIDSYAEVSHIKESRNVTAVLKKEGTNLVFEVKDTGVGIPSENEEKIFEPFFTTKEYGRGIGLGLSTTKTIVEKNFQGTVTMKSTPRHGTQFTITIPLS